MAPTALITGGAGFIGSHVANELLEQGWRVRALDNLTPQVHESGEPPSYLNPDVELQIGDVRDARAVRKALDGARSEEHTSELQSRQYLVCRLLLEKKKT